MSQRLGALPTELVGELASESSSTARPELVSELASESSSTARPELVSELASEPSSTAAVAHAAAERSEVVA